MSHDTAPRRTRRESRIITGSGENRGAPRDTRTMRAARRGGRPCIYTYIRYTRTYEAKGRSVSGRCPAAPAPTVRAYRPSLPSPRPRVAQRGAFFTFFFSFFRFFVFFSFLLILFSPPPPRTRTKRFSRPDRRTTRRPRTDVHAPRPVVPFSLSDFPSGRDCLGARSGTPPRRTGETVRRPTGKPLSRKNDGARDRPRGRGRPGCYRERRGAVGRNERADKKPSAGNKHATTLRVTTRLDGMTSRSRRWRPRRTRRPLHDRPCRRRPADIVSTRPARVCYSNGLRIATVASGASADATGSLYF